MNWLLARLREPSTWRGLVWLATVAGLSLRPDQAEAIVAAGMALAGLLGVFLSDTSRSVSIGNSDGDCVNRSTISVADPVRADLPELELVGKSMDNSGRIATEETGVGHCHPSIDSSINGVYPPMPSNNPSRPSRSIGPPNTYPRFGSGFGDRD